jgi:hypothetical protein
MVQVKIKEVEEGDNIFVERQDEEDEQRPGKEQIT